MYNIVCSVQNVHKIWTIRGGGGATAHAPFPSSLRTLLEKKGSLAVPQVEPLKVL